MNGIFDSFRFLRALRGEFFFFKGENVCPTHSRMHSPNQRGNVGHLLSDDV
jgi:hypothetical protein